jgi:hypothetical protein
MPSSASRPDRRPDPSTRQLWQQRLERFRHVSVRPTAYLPHAKSATRLTARHLLT